MLKRIAYKAKNLLIALLILLVLYVILLVCVPRARGGVQILSILYQAMLPAILAWGVAFVCKLGLWHFAAGANVIAGIILGALEKRVSLIVGVFIGSLTVQLIRFGIVALGISDQFNNAAVAVALLVFCAISSESEPMMKLRAKLRIPKRKKRETPV